MTLPSISVVIPTLNAASVLEQCLAAIAVQDYPKELVGVIIADGGSTDATLKIAAKYGAKIYENPLKTGEAGKAVGVKKATGDLVALIDSDNFLPDSSWFKRMVDPFSDPEIVGAEPWEYTWRREDGFIDRYCALMGMNDPLCYFIGNYDRMNLLSGKWTEVNLEQKDRGDWLKVTLAGSRLQTIGANGTVLRRNFLEDVGVGDYLFDIDLLARAVAERGELKFAKVKVGIVHAFCGSDIAKFARKQRRRIRDMLFRRSVSDIFVAGKQGGRSYQWDSGSPAGFTFAIIKFILACITIVPLFYQSVKGYFRKPDWAWLAHPLLCWVTLISYVRGTIESFFSRTELSRKGWSQ